ncbi:MAG TPA: hypothetical protein VKY45_09995, partial [Marinilabiliaceae bacterium]|nr:hypothetical protein [Marinilabiliaceae bacterium]
HNFQPPKKTNTIVLKQKCNATDFLVEYAKHLQDFGFAIEKIDKDLLNFSTEFKSYKASGVGVIKILAFARQKGEECTLVIRGNIELSNPYGGQVPMEACNCGMIGDNRKKGFNEILNTLTNFNYDSIEFETK